MELTRPTSLEERAEHVSLTKRFTVPCGEQQPGASPRSTQPGEHGRRRGERVRDVKISPRLERRWLGPSTYAIVTSNDHQTNCTGHQIQAPRR
jgi:hypothetical protein